MPIEELTRALSDAQSTLMVTGSGISASAGLPTYRGTGAPDAALLPAMSAGTYRQHLPLLWETVLPMVSAARRHGPTRAHSAIEELRQIAMAGGRELIVATQNIDGLHQLAGTPALELHGSVLRAREVDASDAVAPVAVSGLEPPRDDQHRLMRPDTVFFGEQIHHQKDLESAAAAADLLIMVGTSGNVWPVAGLVNRVRSRGDRTALINLEPWSYTGSFSTVVLDTTDRALASIVERMDRE